ncbi:uncharacterized protein L3040_001964 [Drepanopeziza brunnea f. sp. 'multigermtubi']|uniref:uncharacterized protein n=1 Tax=Drepanopeziza brunnea f. sp. 'multigermtubi' TaxID=698441 RepID=UPI00238B5D25|nr:hypothetical protein L3040_001964 [Drepanopeziza brunnea f. sp. 'multigermtubi']
MGWREAVSHIQIEVGIDFEWFLGKEEEDGKPMKGVELSYQANFVLDAINDHPNMRSHFPSFKRLAIWQHQLHAELSPVRDPEFHNIPLPESLTPQDLNFSF